MHELSVVFSVMKDCVEVAKENNAPHISSVTIQLGKVSGVIPSYLKDCWKWAVSRKGDKTDDVIRGAELIVEPIEAITFCEDCKQTYDTIKYAKVCPHCGSENTFLYQGNEFMIKEIQVDDEMPTEFAGLIDEDTPSPAMD